MKKKGQAAMEFLLTYGWAILIVVLVIGALAYFGVLSPRQFLPSRCLLDSPLYCEDKQVVLTATDVGDVRLLVGNGHANTINLTNMTITDDESLVDCTELGNALVVGTPITSGADQPINITGCKIGAEAGKKVKLKVAIDYTDQSTEFEHTSVGEMVVAIE